MERKEKVTVGVVGAGMISDIYLANMTKEFPNLKVKAVTAMNLEKARAKAEKYGIAAVSQEEMLKDPEIDMIVNLTPVGAHYDVIKRALLAGKHVYTEKTLTDNLAEAKELVELAKEKGLLLGAAPDTFLGEAYQTARRAIDEGMLGQITSFSIAINRCNDVLLGIFPNNRVPGNGILFDYGVYYMTALVSLLGPVSDAAAITQNPIETRINRIPFSKDFGAVIDCPNESVVDAILKLESGVSGTFHVNAESAGMDQAYFAIFGRKGILYLTDANQFRGEVKFLSADVDPRNPQPPIVLKPASHSLDNARGIGPADMAEAILNGGKTRPSGEMAYHVLDVLTAIRDSHGIMTKVESTCDLPAAMPRKDVGIRHLAHAGFNMKNTEAMMHFYHDILEMPLGFEINYDSLFAVMKKDSPEMFTEEGRREMPEEARKGFEHLLAKAGKRWLRYLKLSDEQFLEFFYDNGDWSRSIANRSEQYGYQKLNFEVTDIQVIRDHLAAAGVAIDQDIHPTLDGSTEIMVHDPDGNEVQFTEYTHGLPSDDGEVRSGEGRPVSLSRVEGLTQLALQVKDDVNMLRFYTDGLGLKLVKRLTVGDLADVLAKDPGADQQAVMMMRMQEESSWIDYLEVAPHEYIELFHTMGQEKKEDRDLSDAYGYQHFCIEVEDIYKAWDAVVANGLTPDSEISAHDGLDGTLTFWLVDPDGNRFEIQQYTEKSLQMK